MKKSLKLFVCSPLLFALATTIGTCVPTVSIEGAACPCPKEGYKCCNSVAVCVPQGESCPPGEVDTAATMWGGQNQSSDDSDRDVDTHSEDSISPDTESELDTETQTENGVDSLPETDFFDSESEGGGGGADTGTDIGSEGGGGGADTGADTGSEGGGDSDTVDTETEVETEPPLSGEGEPCSQVRHCQKGLLCHAWKVVKQGNRVETVGPQICARKCDFSRPGGCDSGEICRLISYIEGDLPTGTNVLHDTACVPPDSSPKDRMCKGQRCPEACANTYFPNQSFCVGNSIYLCTMGTADTCGLICHTSHLLDCGEAVCNDDNDIVSCDNGKSSILTREEKTCVIKDCEEECGSNSNIGREYCDGMLKFRCWTAEYKDQPGHCDQMCLKQWTGLCVN